MLNKLKPDTEQFPEVSEDEDVQTQENIYSNFICHFPDKIGFFSSAILQTLNDFYSC